IACTGSGKGARWRRTVDFASFLGACALRISRLPRYDLVIATTSPPLLPALGAALVKMRGGALICWVMDLHPDEAVASGWLKPESLTERFARRLATFSFRAARWCVVNDRFMAERLETHGVPPENIAVIPPWPHDDAVRYDAAGREQFRHEHGLDGRFVVMYAGNYGPCHPLETLLEAARRMKEDSRVVFCFIGEGSEFARVKAWAAGHRADNILCLPSAPLSHLSASLSAGDIHAVVMGDAFVGIVHPSNVYNVLALGIPVLYIGPARSHVADLAPESGWMMRASHGDADRVVEYITRAAAMPSGAPIAAEQAVARRYSTGAALSMFLRVIEAAAHDGESVCVS
ncbi:MAG TPA: glycosyltransferase family 4 protein, partial [Bryobacteraceae bacterium]|nr:glycosyltransferase family 4 protein [Bryobacteraceae bacterium]